METIHIAWYWYAVVVISLIAVLCAYLLLVKGINEPPTYLEPGYELSETERKAFEKDRNCPDEYCPEAILGDRTDKWLNKLSLTKDVKEL